MYLKRLLLCVGLLAAGCARVDPGADFRRAGEMIGERTGVEAYQPDLLDETIETRIGEMCADGLTLDEAVRIAFLNNREFQSLFHEIGASRADVVQATLLSNPSVSFVLKFPEGGGRSNLQFGLAQELVDLWQIPVRRKIAEVQLEQVVLRVAQRAVEIRAEVKSRCYELMTTELAQATARRSLDLVRQSLDLSESQFRAGEVSQFDVNLQRGSVLDANMQCIELQRDHKLAEAGLGRVLGLSRSDRSLKIAEALPDPVAIPGDEELISLALGKRFDAQLAEREVAQAENELDQQYLKVFPSVTAGFELERTELRAMPGRSVLADTARSSVANGQLTAPDIQSRAQRAAERRQIIDAMLGPSLQATLPIWDQNQAQIAKAKFNLLVKRKRRDDLLNAIAADIRRDAAQLRGSLELHVFYRDQALPQADQTVEGARRLYRNGEQNVLALIEAQRSLVARRAAYVTVLRSYWVALAELESAVGGKLSLVSTTRPAASRPG